MTNLERMKNYSLFEMLEFIMTIINDYDSFFSTYYCSHLCEYRIDGQCTNRDDDGCGNPCSWEDEVRAYLEAEVEK